MWQTRCERCGAGAQVALAPPRVVECEACGLRAPVPPELDARLAKAAELLASSVARTKRLGGVTRGLISLGRRGVLFLAIPLGLAVFFTSALGAVQLFGVVGGDGASVGRMCILVPLAASLLLFGGGTLLALRRRIDGLSRLLAAGAPAREGEPFRCPSCGGPVAPRGVRAIVACDFCRSDVILDPTIVARAERAHAADVAELETTIAARSRDIAAAGIGRALGLFVGAVALSFLLAVCGGVVGALVDFGRIVATTPMPH